LGYGPQNGVRNGLFTLKLDLWTAFGYTGFSVEGLLGIGAFGYTGFSVLKPPQGADVFTFQHHLDGTKFYQGRGAILCLDEASRILMRMININ
jgi:hypothetical protein